MKQKHKSRKSSNPQAMARRERALTRLTLQLHNDNKDGNRKLSAADRARITKEIETLTEELRLQTTSY